MGEWRQCKNGTWRMLTICWLGLDGAGVRLVGEWRQCMKRGPR